jgi:hypothetical protein
LAVKFSTASFLATQHHKYCFTPAALLLLLLLQALQLDLSGASVAYYSLPALAVLVSTLSCPCKKA